MKRKTVAAPERASTRHHLALVTVCVVLLFVAVSVPFAVGSVVANVVSPQSHHVFELTAGDPPSASATYVNVDIVGLDEWQGTVSLRVSGEHQCHDPCTWSERLTFVSIPEPYASGQGLPPAQEVMFPRVRARPVNQTIQLPVYGEPVHYPYDGYHFSLGILTMHVGDDGSDLPVDPSVAPGQQLFVSMRMQAPRMLVSKPGPLSPSQLVTRGSGPSGYALTASMAFSRPLYLQALAVLLVLLVTAAAAYAVFLRPLDEIVLNSGALVLGVWGIRAILLGTNMPGFTAVDLALSVVILFMLVAITVRALLYLWGRERGGGGSEEQEPRSQ